MTSAPQPDLTPPALQPQAPAPLPAPARPTNGLATAGFVLGLLGFLGSFIPLLNIVGIIMGVLGAILAAIGLAKAKKIGVGKGLAWSGLILGVLAVIIGIIISVAFVGAVGDAIDDATKATVTTPTATAPVETPDGTAASPTDAAATDATDAAADADELGTTRENPVPLGSAIASGDWTVTINSVTTAKQDAYDQLPAAGSTLLVVNVTATYEGDDKQGDTAWANVKFVTADGTTIDSTDGSTLFMAKHAFDSLKTLYKGGSTTGDEIIEVPVDGWKDGVLAVSASLLSDDTFVAVK